jgi:hypothetical protein
MVEAEEKTLMDLVERAFKSTMCSDGDADCEDSDNEEADQDSDNSKSDCAKPFQSKNNRAYFLKNKDCFGKKNSDFKWTTSLFDELKH